MSQLIPYERGSAQFYFRKSMMSPEHTEIIYLEIIFIELSDKSLCIHLQRTAPLTIFQTVLISPPIENFPIEEIKKTK